MDGEETKKKVAVLPEGLHYNLSRLRRAGILPKISRNQPVGRLLKRTYLICRERSSSSDSSEQITSEIYTMPFLAQIFTDTNFRRFLNMRWEMRFITSVLLTVVHFLSTVLIRHRYSYCLSQYYSHMLIASLCILCAAPKYDIIECSRLHSLGTCGSIVCVPIRKYRALDRDSCPKS